MSGRESRVDGGQLDEVRTETWRVKGMSCSVVINKKGGGGGTTRKGKKTYIVSWIVTENVCSFV